MPDINAVYLSGRAVETPTLKQSGSSDYCFLKIAVKDYDFKTKKETTNFISVLCGGKLAPIVCDRVDKGAPITVQAKVGIRKGDRSKGTFDQISLRAEDVVFGAAPKPQRDDDGDDEEPEEEPI
jgi:single-stranded DNA-binding protein